MCSLHVPLTFLCLLRKVSVHLVLLGLLGVIRVISRTLRMDFMVIQITVRCQSDHELQYHVRIDTLYNTRQVWYWMDPLFELCLIILFLIIQNK